jgi:rRNA processing protein Krr1/Pno1
VNYQSTKNKLKMKKQNETTEAAIDGNNVLAEVKTNTTTKAKTLRKPKAKVIGKDGNVFNLIGICQRALKDAKQEDKAKEMCEKIFMSKSYDEALAIMADYCDLC